MGLLQGELEDAAAPRPKIRRVARHRGHRVIGQPEDQRTGRVAQEKLAAQVQLGHQTRGGRAQGDTQFQPRQKDDQFGCRGIGARRLMQRGGAARLIRRSGVGRRDGQARAQGLAQIPHGLVEIQGDDGDAQHRQTHAGLFDQSVAQHWGVAAGKKDGQPLSVIEHGDQPIQGRRIVAGKRSNRLRQLTFHPPTPSGICPAAPPPAGHPARVAPRLYTPARSGFGASAGGNRRC